MYLSQYAVTTNLIALLPPIVLAYKVSPPFPPCEPLSPLSRNPFLRPPALVMLPTSQVAHYASTRQLAHAAK